MRATDGRVYRKGAAAVVANPCKVRDPALPQVPRFVAGRVQTRCVNSVKLHEGHERLRATFEAARVEPQHGRPVELLRHSPAAITCDVDHFSHSSAILTKSTQVPGIGHAVATRPEPACVPRTPRPQTLTQVSALCGSRAPGTEKPVVARGQLLDHLPDKRRCSPVLR